VHQSGRFVIVSNRGHESIAIFRVKQSCGGGKGRAVRGTLANVGFFHTRGETPRHFQFDHSGQFLIVANQDSDTIAVFSFNLTSGEIKYTGHEVSYFASGSGVWMCCTASSPPSSRVILFFAFGCAVPRPESELRLQLPDGR
jgi:6-phosphogluconolactonase (cycloisomerase 2 family)